MEVRKADKYMAVYTIEIYNRKMQIKLWIIYTFNAYYTESI